VLLGWRLGGLPLHSRGTGSAPNQLNPIHRYQLALLCGPICWTAGSSLQKPARADSTRCTVVRVPWALDRALGHRLSDGTCRRKLNTTLVAKPPVGIWFLNFPLERRYALRVVKQRVHQPSFRMAVITAYHGRCALSGLRIVKRNQPPTGDAVRETIPVPHVSYGSPAALPRTACLLHPLSGRQYWTVYGRPGSLRAEQLLVKVGIPGRAPSPRDVRRHAAELHLAPYRPIAERLICPAQYGGKII